MFEKFTQKAIDVVQSAQNFAMKFKHQRVLPSHLLLGLVSQSKGVQAKILNFDKIDYNFLSKLVENSSEIDINRKDDADIFFSKDARNTLKKAVDLSDELNSKFVMPQHIALSLFLDNETAVYDILNQFDIDKQKIISNLKRILDKSSSLKITHPEENIENTHTTNINDFLQEKVMSEILSNAQSKATTSDYEIVGTEQILQSILENKNYPIVEILNKYSIDLDVFLNKLSTFSSRSAEFESSEKQIIFTPNAFYSLMLALDYAKESGSVEVLAEHIILGILKSKRGIAYKILSELLPSATDFEDVVIKKLNSEIPETLAILKLAKAEASEFLSSTIGTEMILLGILSYGTGIAANTLRRLGITLKDARSEVSKLIKLQKDEVILSYSSRAKKVLELAYETARNHKRANIKSENILYAITKVPDCLAMQVLSNLGTDILEVRQGIKQELLGGLDL